MVSMAGDGRCADWRLYGEPIYCEVDVDPEDVLYSGSEDEYYAGPGQRKRRYEEKAEQFLRGRLPLLLSTTLRGPFSKESGWDNPWRGRGGRVVRQPDEAGPLSAELPSLFPAIAVDGGGNETSEASINSLDASRPKERMQTNLDDGVTKLPAPPTTATHGDEQTLRWVEAWVEDVQAQTASRREFRTTAPEDRPAQQTKKRPASPDRLRQETAKRTRTDRSGPFNIGSPTQVALDSRPPRQIPNSTSGGIPTPPVGCATPTAADRPESPSGALPILPPNSSLQASLPSALYSAPPASEAEASNPLPRVLKRPSMEAAKPHSASRASLLAKRNRRLPLCNTQPRLLNSLNEKGSVWRSTKPAHPVKAGLRGTQKAGAALPHPGDVAGPAEKGLGGASPNSSTRAREVIIRPPGPEEPEESSLASLRDESFHYRTRPPAPQDSESSGDHAQGLSQEGAAELEVCEGDFDGPTMITLGTPIPESYDSVKNSRSPSESAAPTGFESRHEVPGRCLEPEKPLGNVPPALVQEKTTHDEHTAEGYDGSAMASSEPEKPQGTQCSFLNIGTGAGAQATRGSTRHEYLRSLARITIASLSQADQPADQGVGPDAGKRCHEAPPITGDSSRSSVSLVDQAHGPASTQGEIGAGRLLVPEPHPTTTGLDISLQHSTPEAGRMPEGLHRDAISAVPQQDQDVDRHQTDVDATSAREEVRADHADIGSLLGPDSPRLGTQDQSPWDWKPQDVDRRPGDVARSAGKVHSRVEASPACHKTANPSLTAPASPQSPWAATDDVVIQPQAKHLTSPSSPSTRYMDRTGGLGWHGLAIPSTPAAQQSSLPTPDFTLSIKSFRRFSSPSPEPPVRSRGRGILRSGPPRASENSKPKRRVHFDAPAEDANRDENDFDNADRDNDEDYIEAGLPKRPTRGKVRPPPQVEGRAASPPPPRALLASLPAEVEKFRQHFDVVASRGPGGAGRRPRKPLLPSASQQLPSSPPADAMASRFEEVDAQAASRPGDVGSRGEKQTAEVRPPEDDISAVLDNLGDFLEIHDVSAELSAARAAAGRGRNSRFVQPPRYGIGLEVNPWL